MLNRYVQSMSMVLTGFTFTSAHIRVELGCLNIYDILSSIHNNCPRYRLRTIVLLSRYLSELILISQLQTKSMPIKISAYEGQH